VVCLQEVGENWNGGHGDWNSKAAKIICDRLGGSHFLYTDWGHIGFGRYREGTAILSRYPFLNRESGYVSDTQDIHNFNARKIVMGQVHVRTGSRPVCFILKQQPDGSGEPSAHDLVSQKSKDLRLNTRV
jgi:endonuclease/exonuclease/phosphatase family metal-dependent hydrolase